MKSLLVTIRFGARLCITTALIRVGVWTSKPKATFGATAVRLLEAYIKAVRPHLATGSGGKALFLDAAGRRMRYHTLRRLVHACAEAAGLHICVTPHTFRRSCTTELLRSGANMYHVKELLGHESLDTLKHYARLTITDLKKTHRRCHPRERDGREARG